MSAPQLINAKSILAIKGFALPPVQFKNNGGAVAHCNVLPELPNGLKLSIDHKTVVLSGTPLLISARTLYTITAGNEEGASKATIEITITDAPIKTQRGEIIAANDKRQDLDTPRSQMDEALSDSAMMGNTIKPHEKFDMQPMGDDKRLSQQTANNPEAENRAESSPELTPSPSAKLQAQAVARATPNMTPSPTPGK